MPLESNPYLPSTLSPLVAEMWQGIRTDTNRVGVPEGFDFWYDGFFPYAPRRLRTMPDLGASIYTSVSPSIIFYKFVNLGANPLCIVVLSDGSVVQVNTSTLVATTIMTAGTIAAPLQTTVDINQWGASYILIVASQINGYWIWDGSILYTSGTLGPIVTLVNVGSGYTSAPLVTASGGHGSGAQFNANLNATGGVGSVVVTNPGSGYLAGDSIALTFTGGQTSGTGASVTASLTHQLGGTGATATITAFGNATVDGTTYFTIKTISVTAAGSSYSSFTKITPTGGSTFVPAQLSPSVNFPAGNLLGVSVVQSGFYVTKPTGLTITDSGGYYVGSTSIVAAGSNYSNFPVLTYTVTTNQSLVQTPVFTPVITNGTFTSVSIVSGGFQQGSVAGTIVITDADVTASATAALMPFGIQGNTIETYSSQIWVGNHAQRFTSAPGSITDFATSDGGLNVTDNDSFLKIGYTRFIQMNGFLWMVADCSVNYIGNVTTSGSPPTTNLSKQNADPEVGTIWPNTVIPWGNQLLIANSWGVFLGLGSRMQKISDELDGIYSTVASQTITPSVAKAIVFNRKIVCVLLQIVDPVSGTQQNKLLIWDGKKWWSSLQSQTLTYIATQEINSVLTAYGTDGSHIYPLFNTASSAFTKTLQTRLWDAPGSYMVQKAASRLFGVARYNSTVSPNLVISVDAENTPTSTYTITGPTVTGNFVLPPQAVGQQGVFTGLTLQTTSADVEIVSLALIDEIVGYRG